VTAKQRVVLIPGDRQQPVRNGLYDGYGGKEPDQVQPRLQLHWLSQQPHRPSRSTGIRRYASVNVVADYLEISNCFSLHRRRSNDYNVERN